MTYKEIFLSALLVGCQQPQQPKVEYSNNPTGCFAAQEILNNVRSNLYGTSILPDKEIEELRKRYHANMDICNGEYNI